jgi:hypothetical protein
MWGGECGPRRNEAQTLALNSARASVFSVVCDASKLRRDALRSIDLGVAGALNATDMGSLARR